MNKYRVRLYEGTIDSVRYVINEKEVEAASIHDVAIADMIPNNFKSYYVRGILFNENQIVYDYGSYSQFIMVEGNVNYGYNN